MHGKRNSELVADLIGGTLTEDVVFAHGAEKERVFREMMLAEGIEKYRVPGVTEFLERHKSWPMAIGSNAEPANIDFTLDHFGLRPYFKVMVDGHQVARGKPFPDIYLKAAELLGLKPEQCIVFEDSPTGAAAGLAAGMRVVGVETTPTHFQEGVSLSIKDFTDPALEEWLHVQRD
jgi:HAD superfamily hydrolase (TIGR01509 family)